MFKVEKLYSVNRKPDRPFWPLMLVFMHPVRTMHFFSPACFLIVSRKVAAALVIGSAVLLLSDALKKLRKRLTRPIRLPSLTKLRTFMKKATWPGQ